MSKRSDAWIGLGLLIFCGAMYAGSLSLPRAPYGTLGAGFFPNIILGMVAILSVVLVIQGMRPAGESADRSQRLRLGGSLYKYRNIGYSYGLFFLFTLLLPYVGYLLTSFFFIFLLQALLGPKEWGKVWIYLSISLGTTLVLFLLFRCMLLVILPESVFDVLRLLEGAVEDGVCGSWEGIAGLWN